jgi:hypothetical protein
VDPGSCASVGRVSPLQSLVLFRGTKYMVNSNKMDASFINVQMKERGI